MEKSNNLNFNMMGMLNTKHRMPKCSQIAGVFYKIKGDQVTLKRALVSLYYDINGGGGGGFFAPPWPVTFLASP